MGSSEICNIREKIILEIKKYHQIIDFCESCLEKHGDTHLGVAWTRKDVVDKRYQAMLDIIQERDKDVSVLDFGCGLSHLYEYILKQKMAWIHYSGLDMSDKFLAYCREKFPEITYYQQDVLTSKEPLPVFDYVIMCGIFNSKLNLSQNEMMDYFRNLTIKLFQSAKHGIAFNVMTKYLDWERDDLFHLGFDELASFLSDKLGRNFVIKHDYGGYEYTVHVYK